MVGANTFREPTLVAKMATTLDHISGGRAILGIGAAWFEEEHTAFGLRFGDGPPERLRWLGEALPMMRGMLDGTEPTASGPRYAARKVRNQPRADPAPPADPRRRRRRAGHAQARRPLRRREQRGRRHRQRPAQGGDPAPALRGGRPGPSRDRAHDRHRDGLHPRRPGRGGAAVPGRVRAEQGGQPVGRPAGRDARRTWPSGWRRTSSSAIATSSPGCRRPTTRSR